MESEQTVQVSSEARLARGIAWAMLGIACLALASAVYDLLRPPIWDVTFRESYLEIWEEYSIGTVAIMGVLIGHVLVSFAIMYLSRRARRIAACAAAIACLALIGQWWSCESMTRHLNKITGQSYRWP